MKSFAFLLLAVAFVHAYSNKPFAWEPEKEYTYRFESQVLTGIPQIREQYSGLKLLSKVKVQSFPDFTLRIKLEEPRFTTFNGELSLTEVGRIIGTGGPMSGKETPVIPEEFKRYLEQPFLVQLKRGVVQKLLVASEEPSIVTNIKKSLLSQLQVDITGSQRTQLEDNHIQIPISRDVEESGVLRGEVSYFSTMEESLHGECLTEYNVHPLPAYRAMELEEEYENEEKRLGEAGEHRAVNAKLACQGKKYYQINKIRNFDQCKIRPIYQQQTGISGFCDHSKSNCKDMMTSLSSTTMIVCAPEGELTKFVIRKIVGEDEVIQAPMGWNTKETMKIKTHVSIELLEVRPVSGKLPVPSGTKEEPTLIYKYPGEQEQKISMEVIRETEELIGQRPVLPQPTLTGPQPLLLPIPRLPFEEIKRQVVPKIHEVARLIFESPEGCSMKKDVAGKVMSIATYGLKYLSLSELKQLQQVVLESTPQGPHMPKVVKELWMDIVAITASNPSVMLIKENVERGLIVGRKAGQVLSTVIRNVKTPTQELMKELVKLVKMSESHVARKEVLIPTLLQLSNLFYRAYVNPTTMVTQFPVKVYGVFGKKDSEVLVREYIPFLVEKLFSSEHEELKLTIISALGKTGHIKVVKPLLKLAETQEKMPVTRSLAIYSLKRVAKRNPVELKTILSAIINNPVENEQVRMAAIAVLPWTMPTVPELQKLAIRTWFEPSKQVSSFIVSTLRSLAYIEVPELKYLRPLVRPIVPMVKPYKRGIQFSQNIHSGNFVQYLKTAVSGKLQVTNSKTQLLPTHLSLTSNLYGQGGVFEVKQISLTAYMQGMERLLDDYLYLLGQVNKPSQHVQEQLRELHSKLAIEGKKIPLPEAFLQLRLMDYEYASLIDSQKIEEIMEEALRQMETASGHSMEFNYIKALQMVEMQGYAITSTGFPVYYEYNLPLVVAAEGEYVVKSSPSNSLIPYLKAKITPVVNVKLQTIAGVISPFTKELLGSGVEMGLHTSLPIEIELQPRGSEVDIIVKNPVEAEQRPMPLESFHLFVKPFTVKAKALEILPITKGQLKEILTGKEMKKISMPIGESIGLKADLYAETDVDFNDLYSYYEKVIQHSLVSLPTTALLPSTVRKSMTKIEYNPKESETKEMKITLKLSTKEPREMGYERSKVYSRINAESLEASQLHNIKKVVEQLEREESSASLVHVKGSLKGRYNEKSFSAGLLLGGSYLGSGSGHVSKTIAALDFKPVNGQQFGILYEGKLEMPRMNFRWSKSKLLQENPQMKYTGKIEYGLEQSPKKEIILDIFMEKSQELSEKVRQSPEYKMCEAEEAKGYKLAPVCMKVRHEAAALDKMKLIVKLPRSLTKYSLVQMLGLGLKGGYIYQIDHLEPVPSQLASSDDKLKIEAVVSRIGDAAQVYVKEESGEHYKIKNVRLGGLIRRMVPLSVRNPISDRLIQKLTFENAPASCRIQPGLISTFDNRTYHYKINKCEHLLVADRTMKLPVAVLARSMPQGENKIVKILAGHFEIVLEPQSPSGPSKQLIKLNERHVELSQGQTFKEKSSVSDKVLVEIKRYVDDVYFVYIHEQGLQVLTNGKNIEVIVPQLLWSKTAGVCGDNNGENTADLKSPKKCVMEPKIGAVSYILNKNGSPSEMAPQCEGIPSQYRQKYQRQSQMCLKEHDIPTKTIEILKMLPVLNKPVVSAHVVDKQRNQVCISRQKIKICSGQSLPHVPHSGVSVTKPVQLKPKIVDFVCIPRPSSKAESLVKRALAGETISEELSVLPLRFRKTQMEPVACAPVESEEEIRPLEGQEQYWESQEQRLINGELQRESYESNLVEDEELYGERPPRYGRPPMYSEDEELYGEQPPKYGRQPLYGEEREQYLYGEDREEPLRLPEELEEQREEGVWRQDKRHWGHGGRYGHLQLEDEY